MLGWSWRSLRNDDRGMRSIVAGVAALIVAVRGGIVQTHAVPEGEPAPAGSVFAGYCDECVV